MCFSPVCYFGVDCTAPASPSLLSPLALSQAQVQVITNITPTTTAPLDLGTHANTVGTITEITGGSRPNNGTDPGTNLFHSFDFFTVGTGDVAHFINDMKLPTTKDHRSLTIGRELSTIAGTLRTNFPGDPGNQLNFGAAHLWLVLIRPGCCWGPMRISRWAER